jgi:hypothetical protein
VNSLTLGRKNRANLRQILGYSAKTPTARFVGKLTKQSMFQLLILVSFTSPARSDVRVGFVSDVGLSYLDRLKNPLSPSLLSTVRLLEEPKVESDRTVGLTRMALGLRFTTDDKTWMAIHMRPDSSLRDGPSQKSATEWDSRSGTVRVGAREIEFLDEYSVGAKLGSAKFEIGAFAAADPLARSDLLDFGLRVVGPQNFFAAKCNWAFGQPTRSPQVSETTNASDVLISVFQGPDDQNDQFSSESRSSDEAPSTHNPNPGFVLGYSFNPTNSSANLSVLASNYTRIEQSEKYSDFFVRAGLKTSMSVLERQLAMGLIIRANIERDFGGGQQNKDLLQTDTSLNSSIEISNNRFLDAQFDYGRGQIPLSSDITQIVQTSGYQFQMGIRAEVLRSVYASAFFGHEYRVHTLSGKKTGGFGSDENPYKSSDRFLISINYIAAGVL